MAIGNGASGTRSYADIVRAKRWCGMGGEGSVHEPTKVFRRERMVLDGFPILFN